MSMKNEVCDAYSLFRNRANPIIILVLIVLLFNILLFIPSFSFAENFSTKTIGDYGNVTVMEVTGSYDAKNPDGTINSLPRQIITEEFFKTHKDEYDFIVIFSNFYFQMPDAEAKAFYLHVKNDIQGIGNPLFDNSSLFGSNGKLQGIIDMGNIATLSVDPTDPEFEETLSILAHEHMHRWGAYVKFKDSHGTISTYLLGKDDAHWSYLLNSYGSVLYGNQWQDNGNGTFTSIATQKYYSPLDLYLMGVYDKSQVPPMLLIENTDIDPARMPAIGATIAGTPRYITIDDIISAEGERIPGRADAQKNYKTAFIFITAPGTFTGDELYGIENIRNGWVTRFSVLTDGKGITQVVSTLKDDIPVNPGIPLPPSTSRTLPPSIEDGVSWLMDNQKTDGSWIDLIQTTERDTSETVFALKNFTVAGQQYSAGLQWLGTDDSENTDYLSRKTEALAHSGRDVNALIEMIVARQNPDGGWGINMAYTSNTADTSLTLKALSTAGYANQNIVSAAIGYLKTKQNPDGGWGGDDENSAIESTANALTSFSNYRTNYQIEDQITRGIAWLTQRQNQDGGFGNSPSTVYDSALAVMALREYSVSSQITNNGLDYILDQQSENGSWHESPYQTALAISAVWKATIDPDLSVKADDITFIPSVITSLPTNLVMNVNIWNSGRTDVSQAKVALYKGAISEANKISEQAVAFPGQSSVTVTFSVAVNDGNEHRFYISVDPENILKESNEANNTAVKILYPQSSYDFEILPSDVTVSQNPVDIFNDVKITSKVTNKGTMNAYNVQLKYYIDDPQGAFDIATATVDIPAGTTITNEITWRANKEGQNLPITVLADPFNTFQEISKENNKAFTYLTVNSSTEPNLTISYKDMTITPNPVNQGGNVNISALIKNDGFSAASNIKVDFYKGRPGVDGVLLGSSIIQSLNPGESTTVSSDWTNIPESGERIIYVRVDSDSQIQEIREDDNDAFTTLKIRRLPDLTVSTNSITFAPPAPKEGDIIAVNVTIKNRGEQGVSDVTVRAYEGGTIIGSQIILSIPGNSQASTTFTYDTAGKSGAHEITVVVDPDNAITEQSEDNNNASKPFGVQNANLWLTEQYISPNGDGVKDSTQFFFRLSSSQTVKILVFNNKEQTVRTFRGNEFNDTTSGNIIWDGLDDNGMVVDDGQYQIKIVGTNNNVLGSLLVVVDNNRSPLTDAIGTKYLLNTNLTCMLPDIYDEWEWLPNESGIVFSINYSSPNTPEYQKGLYAMSPNGDDIIRLIPEAWSADNYAYYPDSDGILSPDGNTVAFRLWKYKEEDNSYWQELWTVDADGRNVRPIVQDKRENFYSDDYFSGIAWSPDSKDIAYISDVASPPDYYEIAELWIVNTDTLEKTKIDDANFFVAYYEYGVKFVEWASDSNEIAYVSGHNCPYLGNSDCHHIEELKVSDRLGNTKNVFTATSLNFDESFKEINWLVNRKIIAIVKDHLNWKTKIWLFDASGNGDNKELISDYDFYDEFSIAPDKKSLAFITSREKARLLNVADVNGNTYVLHELETSAPLCFPSLYNLVWSPDSSRIAFLETITACGDCPSSLCSEAFEPHIVAIDLKTKTESILSHDSLHMVQWLSDNISIVGQRYDKHGREVLSVVNTEKGDIVNITFDMDVPYSENKLVSPLEGYLSFYKNVDPSSVCYGSGNQDLWAISSLLNLTVNLSVVKEKASLILKGTAADLHFDGYVLEYADTNTPETWNLIIPPSDIPVVNDIFTAWVSPYEGTFYVRVTVWDKAGNVAMNRKKISWGLSSSITNLYKSREMFSPNGDGVKDTIELHYRVLEPVHLEFTVYDANNSVIRTIKRDYSSPADDYITWDGRDSSGKIVSDGKYRIKVFDYEFFVEVDNTPPEAGISLTEIKQDFDIATPEGSLDLYVVLYGHAVDSNMKNWSIEYGEGENPSDWYNYFNGMDQLVGKDEDGNPVLNPVKDTALIDYTGPGITSLVGMKLRITAEDFAGNKSSDITDFLEEKINLYDHQWKDLYERFALSDQDTKYPALALPVMHILGGLETIRLPLATMNLQYYSNRKWSDTPTVVPSISGMTNLAWDRSSDAQEINAVRIKGVDIMGMKHLSNEVLISSMFFLDLCAMQAENFLFEELTVLKVQVRSDDDSCYTQWTDFQVYDAAKGDSVPIGTFPIHPSIHEDMHYNFRMIGIGVSGKYYIDQDNENNKYPPTDCGEEEPHLLKLVLKVDYNEADCSLTVDGIAKLKAYLSGYQDNIVLKTLSYYLQKQEGDQLVRRFELSGGRLSDTTIDTNSLPEGNYPVRAVLSYLDLDDNTIKEIAATNSLIVDRVLPISRITYPDKSLMLCPIKISDHKEDWYGINVEGIAVDNTDVKRYELYYGIGENTGQWLPAMTRKYDPSRKAIVDAPITGNGSKQGELGVWNVTDMKGPSFSLKLKNIDIAGNVSCYATDFSIDNVVEITNLSIDKTLFSPNGDGVRDDITINYQIDEYATADVKVFELHEEADGSYIPDTTPVRTIASGLQHLSGMASASWDGKDDSGMTVAGGRYAIAALAKDFCGTTTMKWIDAEVDNTPPTAIITYPRPPDPIGNIVEVQGTADDTHFQSSTLEAGQGDSPDTWNLISSNSTTIQEDILGIWNIFGLNGIWTLRLTASDTAGNKNETTVVIDLGVRKDLIKDLSATPRLFSPNTDGRLDTVNINYELTDACQVQINIRDSIGVIKKTYTTTTPSAGTYSFIWDGRDSLDAIVIDGTYTAKLSAALSSNFSVTHEEAVTIVGDSTLPMIDIRKPLNNSYLKGDIVINGTIVDNNILEYSITYSSDTGSALVDKANQNRENYTFGILDELPEGSYLIQAQAKDFGENSAVVNIPFTIDRTPPKVTLDNPTEGEYYGSGRNTISAAGVITEKNLDVYSLRYGLGDNPTQWTELTSGNTMPGNPQLFTWQVGKADGIADGLYTLSLYAKDKAGSTGEARGRITIDNTPPEVSITSLQDGGYVRSLIDIKGTASDSNFEKFTLELSEGPCSSAFKWAIIKISANSVRDGIIYSWKALPSDGDYCLRLTAIDKIGNKSDTKANVKVDTHPPVPTALSGKIENRSNTRLTWTQNTEPDLSGYNLYRDSQKINTTLISDITYLDQNLAEGIYAYSVTAVDFAGNESEHSNEIKLKVDSTGPDAKIHSPLDGSMASGIVDIKGTAYSADDFRQYRIYIGQGSNPSTWNRIRTSPVPVSYGALTQWDTLGYRGLYSIKLEAEDLTGNISSHQIVISIDDTPPAPPVFISAIPNGTDVILTWQANTEPDLAGYLLYRNNQLANVSGTVIGDLKPYLISGTTYLDKNVPDGKHNYFLIAADQAGNLSEQSNALEVNIDTRPPHATIGEPADKYKFQDILFIRAESPDTDISVQFQYKRVQDSVWDNLCSPVTQTPYTVNLDPVSFGLPYGDYNLRALATDQGGKTDPSPASITLAYTDMTSGDIPHDLKAVTNGKDVALTWTGNAHSDLEGYNVYRTSGTSKSKINGSPITEAAYQDQDLPDGVYTYEVAAVGMYGNESSPSSSVSAKVYAPSIQQPYTPTGQQIIEIHGSNASANSTVELFNETLNGLSPVGSASADAEGKFILPQLNLSLGENRVTAKATDNDGNISRVSDMAVVVYNEPPSVPVGFTTAVEDHSVTLTWSPNTEPDLSGYNLYRNGEKMNGPMAVITGSVNSSSSYYYNLPAKAFDSDTATYWMPAYNYDTFKPVWWEIALSSPELINHLEIYWGNRNEAGEETVYAGKYFEIQMWSGYAWITHTRVTGNNDAVNVFDLQPSYRTDKIRIYITDTTDVNYSKQVMLTELKILKDNLITGASYDDLDLDDGEYRYNVTAVDYYGFEGMPSDEDEADVGDITPPSSPQNLTATASGSDVVLNWASDSEPDLTGYNIFRNTAQGWLKINQSIATVTAYTDTNLLNGTYSYRVTAVDAAGNESLPSNEAVANVSVPSPEPPVNLRVTPVPEGGGLSTAWDYPGTAAGYTLYRSLTAGGPYTKIGSLLPGTSYLDSGLTNGTAYYYVVTAVDSIGNGSAYSNEATGIPSDVIFPAKPVLFFPAISENAVVLYHETTDISGFAEPAHVVELSGNGEYLGKTDALGDDLIERFALDENMYSIEVSPDGKTMAYEKNNVLWVTNISTEDTVRICEDGFSPVWSPDGNRIAYIYADNNWNDRIAIYDLRTAENIHLTADADVYEYEPSWSFDGGKIAFISSRGGSDDVWIKDLNSDSLTQATHSGYASNPKLSPDGTKALYFEYQNLYVIDLSNGNTLMVDDNTDWYSLDWSPDSRRVLFVSCANGNGDIFVYDLDNAAKTQVAESVNGVYNPTWSPDGKSIIFVQYGIDWTGSLWITSSNTQAQRRLLPHNSYWLYDLSWLRTGGITYREPDYVLNTLYLKGYFSFRDMQLETGENIFSAIAADATGNRSVASDQISVILDAGRLPDLEATEDEIFIYPSVPLTGQNVSGDIIVWNKGKTEARDVDTNVYIWDSTGNMKLIKSEHVPSIAPDSGETISFTWDTGNKTGLNRIIAVLDPQNKISEQNETNNVVTKEFMVADNEGVFITANLNSDRFGSDQDVDIGVTIINSGRERNGTLDILIEDENGNQVKTVDSFAAQLTYGAQEHRHIQWNTGSTYAGTYKVHVIFRDGAEVIAENSTHFTILPDMDINSFIVTDKIAYGSNEDVLMTVNIRNNGKNYVIPGLDVKVKITDEFNNAVFGDVKDIINLLPGASHNINSTWNTSLNPAGAYSIVVEIFRNNELVLNRAASFSVKASPIITGNMTVTPAVVIAGNTAVIDYTVQNTGNAAVSGLGLNLFIIDPETQAIMSAREDMIALGINSKKSGEFTSSTQGYSLKTYTALLQSAHQGNTKTLATVSFTVKDGTTPVVTIISPVGDYNSISSFAVSVIDDASGVDRVEYKLDSGKWIPLAVSDLSSGRYSITWTPLKADEGTHSVSFRAVDKAENMSVPVSAGFTVDITPPPPPVISSPPDNSFLQSRTIDIRGVAEPGSLVTMVVAGNYAAKADAVTGEFIFEGISLKPGINKLIFTAEDSTGNRSDQTTHTLRFDISEWLTGTLSVDPNPAYQGEDITFTYTIVNSGDEDIPSLTIGISIMNHDMQEVIKTLESIVSISKKSTLSGTLADSLDVAPGIYAAVLFVSNDQMAQPKTLGIANFEIKASIEAEKTLTDVVNLLVWINDDCHERRGMHTRCKDNHERCKWVDSAEELLRKTVDSYSIVYDKKDFQAELRNHLYTDILIVGNEQPLEDHCDNELRELVYSGKGIISSLFLKDGEYRKDKEEDSSLFGVGYKGRLSGDDHDIDLVDSPVSAAGTLKTQGEALRIEAAEGATVAGWIKAGKGKDGKCKDESYPAIVLNEYGTGKTVYCAFDIAASLDSQSHDRLSEILKNSIHYVHKILQADSFAPYHGIPVEINLNSTGSVLNLRITETYPSDVKIYDSPASRWITENPWTMTTRLEPGEPKSIRYFALLPDITGTYTLETDIEYLDNGSYIPYRNLSEDFIVDKNTVTITGDIIAALNELQAEGRQKARINDAIRHVDYVQKRKVIGGHDIEKNISDILKAIDALISLNGIDVSAIRLQLNTLLRIWEGRYYLNSMQ